MTILDRYVLQKFLLPFIYTFLGFIGIWFIFDLSDNLPDFIQGRASLSALTAYYASQIPEIVALCLPIGALLALLYSLTAMSRSNEIISMLGAGRSVTRILVPLFAMGLVLTGLSLYFNQESVPHAAQSKKEMIRDIRRGEVIVRAIRGHLFRNRQDHRTWFMRRLEIGRNAIYDLQIIQQTPEGEIIKKWDAREAKFNEQRKEWSLGTVRYVEMDSEGEITKSELKDHIIIEGWSETPWRISSSMMNPEYLSVPELQTYLKFNADFPEQRLAPYRTYLYYRFALPWACFVVIFLAAPMGIVYSRRGILGGVALAIGLFFLMVFTSSLALALGKGGRLPPVVAAWGPIVIFFGIGLVLLWYRSTNRDLPKLKLPGF